MGLSKYKFNAGEVFPAENANSIDPENIPEQSAGFLTGGNNPSALNVFNTLGGGSNDGKFSINVDGVLYNNLSLDFMALLTNWASITSDWTSYLCSVSGGILTIGGGGYIYQNVKTFNPTTDILSIKISSASFKWDTNSVHIGLYSGTPGDGNPPKFGFGVNNYYLGFWENGSFINYQHVGSSLITHDLKFELKSDGKVYFYIDNVLVRTSSYTYSGALNLGAYKYNNTYNTLSLGSIYTSSNSYSDIASKLQTAIRTATGKTETVIYSTNHFVISSSIKGLSSKILKLMTPSTGTDISGAGATLYLDCSNNATETAGAGSDYYLARLNADGLLPNGIFPSKNYSTADQAVSATTRTYITGSLLSIPSTLKVGTQFRWKFNMTKTGAGSASSTIDIAFGTAGTTADTARVSFTKPAGTAVADEAWVDVIATVRSIGASGIVIGELLLVHNLASTGHATTPIVVVNAISSGFDMTANGLKVGLCITTGASDAITIKMVQAEISKL